MLANALLVSWAYFIVGHLLYVEETALVNDWGHGKILAKTLKEEIVYYGQGTLRNASLPILRRLAGADNWVNATVVLDKANDLRSVVCMVFRAVSPSAYEAVHAAGQSPHQLLKFWERHLAPPVWKRMLDACDKMDYEELKTLIRELLPSTSQPALSDAEWLEGS